MSGWIGWAIIGCWCFVIVCMLASIHYSRKSIALNDASRKLRTGETLTARERKLMEKIR